MAGARNNNDNRDDSGHVKSFSFSKSINKWIQLGNAIAGLALDEGVSSSIASSSTGKIITVSIWSSDNNGSVRIFMHKHISNNSDCVGLPIIRLLVGDYFRHSVALSGNNMKGTFWVLNNNKERIDSGHVQIYYSDLLLNLLSLPPSMSCIPSASLKPTDSLKLIDSL